MEKEYDDDSLSDKENLSPESVELTNLSDVLSPASSRDSEFDAVMITPKCDQLGKKEMKTKGAGGGRGDLDTSQIEEELIFKSRSRRTKRVTLHPDESLVALKRQLSFADVVMSHATAK